MRLDSNMVHHDCRHVTNDIDHPLLGKAEKKPTMLGIGYDGKFRCCECKRKVSFDGDWETAWECAPRLEPPYPEGYC